MISNNDIGDELVSKMNANVGPQLLKAKKKFTPKRKFSSNIIMLPLQIGTWRHVTVRNLYSIVYGILDILLWKGVWDGYDEWAGHGEWQATSTLVMGLMVLTLTRTVKTAWSMPVSRIIS